MKSAPTHQPGNRFVVLSQNARVADAEAFCAGVALALSHVTEVEGQPCTIYSHAAFARYTEVEGSGDLKRLVRERLHATRQLTQQGRR